MEHSTYWLAIKPPRVTQAKTSMEVQATILFLPIDDGIHLNFGINVWMKINCGSNASAIEPPNISSVGIVWNC